MLCCVPAAGRYMYKGGKLVPTSLDLYLALEYCDQGASAERECASLCVCVCALAQECVHADCVCVCAQVETCMLACVCGDGRELLVGMLLFARNALLLFDDTAVLTPAVLL